MTSVQEKQIRNFRMKGIGYKAIASTLGLSRDVVRNHCKSLGCYDFPIICQGLRVVNLNFDLL